MASQFPILLDVPGAPEVMSTWLPILPHIVPFSGPAPGRAGRRSVVVRAVSASYPTWAQSGSCRRRRRRVHVEHVHACAWETGLCPSGRRYARSCRSEPLPRLRLYTATSRAPAGTVKTAPFLRGGAASCCMRSLAGSGVSGRLLWCRLG